MKYLITLGSLILFYTPGRGQQVVDISKSDAQVTSSTDMMTGVNGLAFDNSKYVKVTSGSPYFQDEFMKAALYDGDGSRYTAGQVRLNLLSNQIHYMDASGREMISTSPIKRVLLTDPGTSETYTFILGDQLGLPDKELNSAWFQVLVNGPVSLVLREKKSIHDKLSYATATTEEDIPTVSFYYVKMNGSFTEVKSWQDLQTLLADKKDALTQFIHDHHLKGRSPSEYAQVIGFYNGTTKP